MIKRILPAQALLLVSLMWAVFLIDLLIPGTRFDQLGIQPRQLGGLTGIVLSPLLHGGLAHLISNSIPLLILPVLIRLSVGAAQLTLVMVAGVVGSGLGTWLFGLSDTVIGASGLVYALIGYLLADAYFRPSLRSWCIALVSFGLYGGALSSLFVLLPYVSWAAHFWGLVSGLVIASLLRSQRQKTGHRQNA